MDGDLMPCNGSRRAERSKPPDHVNLIRPRPSKRQCLRPNGASDNSQGREPLERSRDQHCIPPQRGGAFKRRPVGAGPIHFPAHSRGFRSWLLSDAPSGRRPHAAYAATLAVYFFGAIDFAESSSSFRRTSALYSGLTVFVPNVTVTP